MKIPGYARFQRARVRREDTAMKVVARHAGTLEACVPRDFPRRLATMSVKAFEPKFMKVGVLTAALQELTPRENRDPDPDLAIEEWVAFASELGADYIQLSAALHPSESDVPAEAMLDPVANTLDLRQPFRSEEHTSELQSLRHLVCRL